MQFDDLIPTGVLPMTPRTEGWLRTGAGGVTRAQFVRYRDVGLLPAPDANGRYPEWVKFALEAIRHEEAEARSLPRRAVRLRANAILFPVATEKLRQAMLDVIPSIRAPKQKLRRVHAATRRSRATTVLPVVEGWPDILRGASDALFGARTPGWYAMASMVLPAQAWPEPSPLWGVPLEEQVILLAVLDLALQGSSSPPMIKRC
jgi:hypothetical protein